MAESRIIKRNVRFWGKSGLQLTGMMLIFMVVYGFLFNMEAAGVWGFLENSLFLWRDHKRFICHDRTGFLCGILSSADIVFWLRKKGGSLWRTDFLCGLCSKRLYHSGICRIMSSGKFNGKLNALIAVLFIFMTAIGQLVSVAQMHFGMKGMIIGIVMVVLGIVIGIVAELDLLTRSWRGSTEYRRM